MITPVRLAGGRPIPAVEPRDLDDLPRVLAALDLPAPRPVIAVIGGADRLNSPVSHVFSQVIAPVAAAEGAIAVDGGTDSGVMRLLGRSRGEFPLVGVAARGTVTYPGHRAVVADPAGLEPHHTHFVLVPGSSWGDESAYLARTASLLAGSQPSVTVLVNGGSLSRADVEHSLAERRPVLVLSGTGRLADELIAGGLVDVVDVGDPIAARSCLEAALSA